MIVAKELTDIEVVIHHQTEMAYLVSTTGQERNAQWVPKSATEVDEASRRGAWVTITLPERMAIDKGLV